MDAQQVQPLAGGAFYVEPSFGRRVLGRLFPQNPAPRPPSLKGWAPVYMTTDVVVQMQWRDRLRVLISGKVVVRTNTLTNVKIKRCSTLSSFSVLPPF